ncbi:glyoxylase-like metal-dependent hydrolase (beta-lactamase superfamily II) [Fictibacillus halophilus]|uniref:Glyoxylase-like metal-dependent hydrolase (Beta-lactamase superfamily II) n=1 Tax=Fictibacillus halophilus TaxID=1610490 RepID=A0ABV2LN67_9BACL|nr:MBL fold metallo-hydrolase [Fictibacillus halophilus]
MEFIELSTDCYYFKSAVNIGYIVNNDKSKGMLIDAGLDSSAAKKVIKQLHSEKLPLTHLFITHAHADHFGGAFYIQQNVDVHTIAPALEEAIMRNPILEPIYLSQGNFPLKEMRNKFLEAPSIRVDELCSEGSLESFSEVQTIHLPGHSYNQHGILFGGTLYAADAFLGKDVLQKHKIPFIVDTSKNIETLEKLKEIDVEGMVPGHGNYVTEYKDVIQDNILIQESITSEVHNIINHSGGSGISFENIVAAMLTKYEVEPTNLGAYSLFRTAISAHVNQLLEQKSAVYKITGGIPVIFSAAYKA